jgi:hypothetical protein
MTSGRRKARPSHDDHRDRDDRADEQQGHEEAALDEELVDGGDENRRWENHGLVDG